MNRTILLTIGVVLLVAGLAVSYIEWASGLQPWGQLLGDNFLFARSLPFTIGLGIVFGFWRASGWRWAPRFDVEPFAALRGARSFCTRSRACHWSC